jgi:alkanesulfonate monooxygenase SsuD/methylene tetrahydromethanopterin reductase-like flavin-dependent oxidoreductase (luciferase family)
MGLKLGVNLGYWGIGPAGDDALQAVLAAEALAYESIWVAESYGSDVVSVLAWLAGQTKTVNLGAAIMQVPARPPAAAAMAGATIDKLSGGRFLFGFGPSGPQVSEGWYGVPYAKPWGRTREYIEVVREIIAREGPVEHHGADEVQRRFQADDRGGAFAAIPDELVKATSLVGTEAEIAERVGRFHAAGVDRLIVSPVHVERDQQLHTLQRLAAIAGAEPVG